VDRGLPKVEAVRLKDLEEGFTWQHSNCLPVRIGSTEAEAAPASWPINRLPSCYTGSRRKITRRSAARGVMGIILDLAL
jgi:hypothetical protein